MKNFNIVKALLAAANSSDEYRGCKNSSPNKPNRVSQKKRRKYARQRGHK